MEGAASHIAGLVSRIVQEYSEEGSFLLPMSVVSSTSLRSNLDVRRKMEKSFPRNVTSLDAIVSFVHTSLASLQVADSESFPINFIIEELFTNAVKYNTSSNANVTVRIERDAQQLIITLQDRAARAFDIRAHEDIDPAATIEHRMKGGLGIYLIKKMVDDIRYEYANGLSSIVVTKQLQ